MAKKKTNKNGANGAGNKEASPEVRDSGELASEVSVDAAEGSGTPPATATGSTTAAETETVTSSAADVSKDVSSNVNTADLQAQLAAAHDEIARLKAQLNAKDAEIAAAKATAATAAASGPAAPATEDLAKLQDRLRQLRKDQADADAAKEAAWRNLKTVIGELSKLAVVPIGAATTPTATA